MNKCKNLNCGQELNKNIDMCLSCGMIQTKRLQKKINLEIKNMVMTFSDKTLRENQ